MTEWYIRWFELRLWPNEDQHNVGGITVLSNAILAEPCRQKLSFVCFMTSFSPLTDPDVCLSLPRCCSLRCRLPGAPPARQTQTDRPADRQAILPQILWHVLHGTIWALYKTTHAPYLPFYLVCSLTPLTKVSIKEKQWLCGGDDYDKIKGRAVQCRHFM